VKPSLPIKFHLKGKILQNFLDFLSLNIVLVLSHYSLFLCVWELNRRIHTHFSICERRVIRLAKIPTWALWIARREIIKRRRERRRRAFYQEKANCCKMDYMSYYSIPVHRVRVCVSECAKEKIYNREARVAEQFFTNCTKFPFYGWKESENGSGFFWDDNGGATTMMSAEK